MKVIYLIGQNSFFSIKIRWQQKVICVWGEGMWVLFYAVKMYLVFGLMLKKNLLPLMIELVVVLNQLGVIQ